MPQETFVTKVPKGAFQSLEASVARGPFEFRAVPHAVFSAKGDGVVATLYTSGKFVIQGPDPQGFLARWTALDAAAPPRSRRRNRPAAAPRRTRPWTSSRPSPGATRRGKATTSAPWSWQRFERTRRGSRGSRPSACATRRP